MQPGQTQKTMRMMVCLHMNWCELGKCFDLVCQPSLIVTKKIRVHAPGRPVDQVLGGPRTRLLILFKRRASFSRYFLGSSTFRIWEANWYACFVGFLPNHVWKNWFAFLCRPALGNWPLVNSIVRVYLILWSCMHAFMHYYSFMMLESRPLMWQKNSCLATFIASLAWYGRNIR